MAPLLRVSGLSVARGGHALLDGLDFSMHAGEVVVVLGPNGAGKSSLLLALAGLIPASGEVKLSGQALREYSRHDLARTVAWQGELPPTEFGLTVRQRLELSAGGEDEAVEQAAFEMEIASLVQRPLGELSTGERQRVELAALMLREAPLWLLDEPTAHLDLKHQVQCIDMLRRQCAAGRSMIVVLHDLQQAVALADYLILVDGSGAAEYGELGRVFTSQTLGRLFDVQLIMQGSLLLPDYGESDESTR